MNAEPTTHPTPTQLAAYGLGKLDDAATAAVARHLEKRGATTGNNPSDNLESLSRLRKEERTQ